MVKLLLDNVNPKGRKTGDCVTRALVLVTGLAYEEVAKMQFDMWMKTGHFPSTKQNYEKLLSNLGFVKHKQPKKVSGSKYLVGEIDQLTNKDQKVFITLANHAVGCINGEIVDTWDCRYKTIGNYFTKISR